MRSAYLFLLAGLTEALEHIFYVLLVYLIVCLSIYKILFTSRPNPFSIRLDNNVKFPRHKRVLLVTSHPDDECMFFGPTILTLSQRDKCQTYVLCLSKGNLLTLCDYLFLK